jgi:hypothetical protein
MLDALQAALQRRRTGGSWQRWVRPKSDAFFDSPARLRALLDARASLQPDESLCLRCGKQLAGLAFRMPAEEKTLAESNILCGTCAERHSDASSLTPVPGVSCVPPKGVPSGADGALTAHLNKVLAAADAASAMMNAGGWMKSGMHLLATLRHCARCTHAAALRQCSCLQ